MTQETSKHGLITILKSTAATKVTEIDEVHERFVKIFEKIHGPGMGEQVYATESFHFNKLLSENEKLRKCTQLSLYGAFIDVAVQGLSFDPSKKLTYLVPYNCKVTENGAERWEERANLQISPYGELYIRQKQGQIKSADNPIIVYEGDLFKINLDNNGSKTVEYSATLPRMSSKIIGGFIRIIRTDNTTDYFVMEDQDIQRLAAYSNKKSRGKGANELYTSNHGQIDPGFFTAKLIKHAFKAYPKASLIGSFSQFETEVIEREEIDYGLEENSNAPYAIEQPANPTEDTIRMTSTPIEPGPGVTVETDPDLNF